MEQLRYINIIVSTVIIVMEELKQTFLFSAGVLVFDTTRAEHIAGIMRHLPGELVRFYIRNVRCNKQFRSCSLPFSDRVNEVCYPPKVVRNSFQRLLFRTFFLIQRPEGSGNRRRIAGRIIETIVWRSIGLIFMPAMS